MIFRVKHEDKEEFVTAKDGLHLLQEYYKEYGEDFLQITEVTLIEKDQAKEIMLKCEDDLGTFSLWDMVVGEDFAIVGSTDH